MQIVDLSRELYHRTPAYPGQPPIIHGIWKTHAEAFAESGNIHGNSVMYFSMPDHGGTHIDAPRHFGPEGVPIDEYPLAHCIVAGDCATRFQRHPGMPTDSQFKLNDLVRGPKSGAEVAVFLANDRGLSEDARCEFPGRLVRREDCRQVIDLDGYEVGSILGEIWVLREHRRDRLADIADPVAGQYGLAIGFEMLDAAFPEIDRGN